LRHEVDDYCDRKLASFEVLLQRTIKVVHAGRAKMQGVPIAAPESGLMPGRPDEQAPPAAERDDQRFFDQDQG
jgi:hypothetical protein